MSGRATRVSPTPVSFLVGTEVSRDPQPTSKEVQDEARRGRQPTLFPRLPEPLPGEDEAAKEKVNFVPQPPEEHLAPRR